MSDNQIKYQKCKKAFKVITIAVENKNFANSLAAICIIESILSDWINFALQLKENRFSSLIQAWQKSVSEPIFIEIQRKDGHIFFNTDLISKMDHWREDRNVLIHGMVKTELKKTVIPLDLETYESKLYNAVTVGERLTRLTDNWSRKKLDYSQKTELTQ